MTLLLQSLVPVLLYTCCISVLIWWDVTVKIMS